MKLFLTFLLLLTGCASRPQFYYIDNVHDFVKPLVINKEFPALNAWREAVRRQPILQGMYVPTFQKVKDIQRECNAYTYKADITKFPTEKEFEETKQGDCKGFAVCKYYKLRAAGFKDSDLNFWVGRYDGNDHLILVVKIDKKEIVMDIGAAADLPEARDYFYKHFYPIYRFNVSGWDLK